MGKTILVTGAAGFIGSHTVERLVKRGDSVVGLDNLNDCYDQARKKANLEEVRQILMKTHQVDAFTFVRGDIRDENIVSELFSSHKFDAIVHLAAMAGVRVSIENPKEYYDVNVMGTINLLGAAVGRMKGSESLKMMPNFVFASTSSVYGNTKNIPFTEDDSCGHPLAPYAGSKRTSELLGYTYHYLYGLAFTSLRFFTVYGPRGRPDMMAYKIFNNIFFGNEVPLYNSGQMHRDWTFVGDIVQGIVSAVDRPVGYEIFNLGRGQPVLLAEFANYIEQLVGRSANLIAAPMAEADILYTYADISKAKKYLAYDPKVSTPEGIKLFWDWYKKVVLENSFVD